jgi:hypothetical protein
LSIGTACLNEVTPRTAAALLEEADKRLYVNKGERKRGSAAPAPVATAPGKVAMRKTA